jgi:DNA-binding beta-propeller fold protein YncE
VRAAVVALLLFVGCGGSGGAPDRLPPTGQIVFPPRGALTEATSIAVTGTATDDRGVTAVDVGTVAAASGDGFLTWHADVPLLPGVNVLAAHATDAAGNLAALPSASVTRTGIVPAGPAAVALAPDGRALVLDATLRTLFLVDLATGAREKIPDLAPSPGAPSGLAVEGGLAYLCDTLERAVGAVDLASGRWIVLSDDLRGTGGPLQRPQSLTLLPGERVAVADAIAGSVVVADLVTGNRTTLATLGFTPGAIAFDAKNGRILVLGADRIVAVDAGSGATTVLTAPGMGGGPAIAGANAIAVDAATGAVFVTDATLAAVFAVDPVSGNRTVVSSAAIGAGTPFSLPRGIAIAGARLLVTDSVLDGLFSVDRATGERTLLSVAMLGSGPPLLAPRDLSIGPAGPLVVDLAQGLVAVDADGNRHVVSGAAAGSGPALVTPLGVSGARNGAVLVADGGAGALFSVVLATGARTVVSDGFLPTDAAFLGARILATDTDAGELVEVDPATGDRTAVATGLDFPRAISVDEAAGIAYVLQAGATPLVAIDVATGAVTPLAAAGLVDPKGLAFDPQGHRLFVTDDGTDTLFALDLATGLFSALAGEGPRYAGPNGIAFDAARGLLLVADAGRGALLAVEPASGARVIVSK